MTIDIEDLRAKLAKAFVFTNEDGSHEVFTDEDAAKWLFPEWQSRPNRDYLLAAVNALPALLDELERLRAQSPAYEWEYAHSANGYWNDDETEFTAEDYYDVTIEPAGALARRVKAGPWLPVEGKNP